MKRIGLHPDKTNQGYLFLARAFSKCPPFIITAKQKMASNDNLRDSFGEFLNAIEEMSHTVMVPHLLLGISDENQLPPTTGSCVCSTDSNDNSIVKPSKELNNSGLYGTYHMLLDIKEELTTGRESSAEGCFRSHVKVVMESMKQLTRLAKSLTQNYCEEVCNEETHLRSNSVSYSAFEDLMKGSGEFQTQDKRRKYST